MVTKLNGMHTVKLIIYSCGPSLVEFIGFYSFSDFWRSRRHPANTRWQRFQLNSGYMGKRQTDEEYRRGWKPAEENTDTERENGKSGDLSVTAMHTDRQTLWIMFLSLGALITVFLVKTNPLVSVHFQSAAMFIANGWKRCTKGGCQGEQTQSHFYHCQPLRVRHGGENAGGRDGGEVERRGRARTAETGEEKKISRKRQF